MHLNNQRQKAPDLISIIKSGAFSLYYRLRQINYIQSVTLMTMSLH